MTVETHHTMLRRSSHRGSWRATARRRRLIFHTPHQCVLSRSHVYTTGSFPSKPATCWARLSCDRLRWVCLWDGNATCHSNRITINVMTTSSSVCFHALTYMTARQATRVSPSAFKSRCFSLFWHRSLHNILYSTSNDSNMTCHA